MLNLQFDRAEVIQSGVSSGACGRLLLPNNGQNYIIHYVINHGMVGSPISTLTSISSEHFSIGPLGQITRDENANFIPLS